MRRIKFLLLLILIPFTSGIEITELEFNPAGMDTGQEWIEFFSEQEIDFENVFLKDSDNDTFFLNLSFQGVYVYEFSGRWLDNDDNLISIIYNNETLFETPLLSDNENDERTWQLVDSEWKFQNPTKGDYSGIDNQEEEVEEEKIILELDFPDEVYFYEVFEVELEISGVEEKDYDIKIEITEEDTISEIYDEKNDEWISGNYYIKYAIKGQGKKEFDINITEDYEGEASIVAKIRKTNSSSALAEEKFQIRVLEKEEKREEYIPQIPEEEKREETREVEVVHLNNQDIEEAGKEVIYTSSKEKIKEYSVYFFIVFSVLLLGFLIGKKFS
jgi:hypothetical protein